MIEKRNRSKASRNPCQTGNGGIYYYYLRDHLGNHRIVMDASGTVVQVNNYYPSGAAMADYPRRTDQGIQPYKFGGKEPGEMHGLVCYDLEIRPRDAVLITTTVIISLISVVSSLCRSYVPSRKLKNRFNLLIDNKFFKNARQIENPVLPKNKL